MDKFISQLEETATINQLLEVVNKREKRKAINYIKYYLPFLIGSILLYTAVVLFIIFGIKKFVPAFISTFSVIFILFMWGSFDKYFGLKIFRRIRKSEIDHFSK